MKNIILLFALAFSAHAFSFETLEEALKTIDSKLSERSFLELKDNCGIKTKYVMYSSEDRIHPTEFVATHKSCTSDKIDTVTKRKKGKLGNRKMVGTYTFVEYKKNNANPLRELIAVLEKGNLNGTKIEKSRLSVHEIKEETFGLLTKDGYVDYNALIVWIDVELDNGEVEQLHVTIANDARLPQAAQLLEVFFNYTHLIQVQELL